MVKQNPHFSIIIPVYNRPGLLDKLLKSINNSIFKDYEVIVVDDVSEEDLKKIADKYSTRYFRLEKNVGAGGARNVGAKKARGKVLVFIDSDVVLFKNTLSELARNFEDKSIKAVGGVYDKIPANPSFFTDFKALRDYSYIECEADPNYPSGGFGGWLSAIRADLFEELGGFDESFKGAGMEDYEFAWRLTKKAKIIHNPKVKIRHCFDSFNKTFLNFYKRSYLWTMAYFKYKRFFSSATNPREAFIAGLANVSTGLFFLSLVFPVFWIVFLPIVAARLWLGRTFLIFAAQEKGVLFAAATLPVSHALYLAVYLGVARAVLERFFKR